MSLVKEVNCEGSVAKDVRASGWVFWDPLNILNLKPDSDWQVRLSL